MGLRSIDDEFVENVWTTFLDDWTDSEVFSLRAPPLSRVQETLNEEFRDDVEEDFMMILESVDTITGDDNELNEVPIEVGRPQLRLLLVGDDLEDVDNLAEQVTAKFGVKVRRLWPASWMSNPQRRSKST